MSNVFRGQFRLFIIGLLAVSIMVFLILYQVKRLEKNKYCSGTVLVGQEIMREELFGFPSEILCIGQHIIILDKSPVKGNARITVHNSSTFSCEGSTAVTGGGVGEVRDPVGLNTTGDKDVEFSIFDLSLQRLTIYRLDKYNQIKAYRIITLKGGMPYEPVMVNDTMIMSLAFGITSNRVAIYDSSGALVRTVGVLLPGKQQETPVFIHNQASDGYLRLKPGGGKFVVSAKYSDIIDIYNFDGRLVKRFHGPLNISPRYDVVEVNKIPVMALDERHAQFTYVDLSVTDSRIYGLYCGRHFSEHKVNSQYVHVYNWNGDFLKTYILNPPVVRLAVDSGGNKFFGIALEPKIKILMYEIKD